MKDKTFTVTTNDGEKVDVVYHGYTPKNEEPKIDITVKHHEENLVFTCSFDGRDEQRNYMRGCDDRRAKQMADFLIATKKRTA